MLKVRYRYIPEPSVDDDNSTYRCKLVHYCSPEWYVRIWSVWNKGSEYVAARKGHGQRTKSSVKRRNKGFVNYPHSCVEVYITTHVSQYNCSCLKKLQAPLASTFFWFLRPHLGPRFAHLS